MVAATAARERVPRLFRRLAERRRRRTLETRLLRCQRRICRRRAASACDDLEDGVAMSPTFLGTSPFSRGLHIHRACIELIFFVIDTRAGIYFVCVLTSFQLC